MAPTLVAVLNAKAQKRTNRWASRYVRGGAFQLDTMRMHGRTRKVSSRQWDPISIVRTRTKLLDDSIDEFSLDRIDDKVTESINAGGKCGWVPRKLSQGFGFGFGFY